MSSDAKILCLVLKWTITLKNVGILLKITLSGSGYSKLQFSVPLHDRFDQPTKFGSIVDYPPLDSMVNRLRFCGNVEWTKPKIWIFCLLLFSSLEVLLEVISCFPL